MSSRWDRSIAFTIHEPGHAPRELALDRPVIHVGKLSTASLRLFDPSVSRRHAVIVARDDGTWRLTDLGSTRGTTLAGRPVVQAPLGHGDRIRFGDATVTVHLAQAARMRRDSGLTGPPPVAWEPAEGSPEGPSGGAQGLEIAMLWGETVLSVQHFGTPCEVRVGEGRGCRFNVAAEVLGAESFALVVAEDGGFALDLECAALRGDVLVDGEVVGVQALRGTPRAPGGRVPLAGRTRARVRLGELTFLLSAGSLPPLRRASPLRGLDPWPGVGVAVSATLHLAFLATLAMLPEERLKSRLDPDARLQDALRGVKVAELEPEDDEPEADEDEPRSESEEDARDHAPTPVREPRERPSLVDRLAEARERPPGDRSKAREMAMTAGAARLLTDGPLMDAITGRQATLAGRRLVTLAAPGADSVLDGVDIFGGDPAGGAGGHLGTKSLGGGEGGPGGRISGLDKQDLRDRGKPGLREGGVEPRIGSERHEVSGRIDPAIVKRVIRAKLSGMRWCYRDALKTRPKLAGRVELRFLITMTGRLEAARAESAMPAPEMLDCMAKKMATWRFPQPKDGGLVRVRYPLVLKPAARR